MDTGIDWENHLGKKLKVKQKKKKISSFCRANE